MAKSKQQKQEMLEAYKAKLDGSMGIIVVSATGITPNQINEFKQKLFSLGSSYNVVKNTIFSLALKQAGLPELETFSAGPNAVVFVETDIAGTAKELKDFIKQYKDLVEIKSGILDGQQLTIEQVQELADMPTKEQSIAMIAGLMTNAVAGVANVLEDSVRSVAIILDQAFSEEKAA